MEYYTHKPVLCKVCIENLCIRPEALYIDGTTGLGGHSEEIARAGGRLVCVDKDREALESAQKRLAPFGDRVRFVHGDFREMDKHLAALGEREVSGVILDLGVSSLQLDKASRGFSHKMDSTLDMRMNPENPLSAHTIVNEWSAERLKQIFFTYGEERYASRIAAAVLRARPVDSTWQLRDLILNALPAKARKEKGHPARRVFQALRIAVNDELGAAEEGVRVAVRLLAPGGRLCVIAFHSLEDRIVKNFIRDCASRCECPASFPVCVCGKKAILRPVARILPDAAEIEENPRAASAVLRVAEKI